MPHPGESSKKFVKAAMNAPYLSFEEEQALAIRWKAKDDQEAMHEMTQAHMRLVISMANKMRHYGLPMSDLMQEGHVGLLEAAARFEPAREIRFSTYATWWIRASMQDYILRNWSIVRGGTSSAQKSLFFNLRRLRARLGQGEEGLSGASLYQEIAGALGVSFKDVAHMDWRLSGADQSLNAPIADSEGAELEKQDFLVCDKPQPDEIVSDHIDAERRTNWLERALATLSERELAIIQNRRLRDQGETLESLGNTFGISKERVRQIEKRAMEKMKKVLLNGGANASHFVN